MTRGRKPKCSEDVIFGRFFLGWTDAHDVSKECGYPVRGPRERNGARVNHYVVKLRNRWLKNNYLEEKSVGVKYHFTRKGVASTRPGRMMLQRGTLQFLWDYAAARHFPFTDLEKHLLSVVFEDPKWRRRVAEAETPREGVKDVLREIVGINIFSLFNRRVTKTVLRVGKGRQMPATMLASSSLKPGEEHNQHTTERPQIFPNERLDPHDHVTRIFFSFIFNSRKMLEAGEIERFKKYLDKNETPTISRSDLCVQSLPPTLCAKILMNTMPHVLYDEILWSYVGQLKEFGVPDLASKLEELLKKNQPYQVTLVDRTYKVTLVDRTTHVEPTTKMMRKGSDRSEARW